MVHSWFPKGLHPSLSCLENKNPAAVGGCGVVEKWGWSRARDGAAGLASLGQQFPAKACRTSAGGLRSFASLFSRAHEEMGNGSCQTEGSYWSSASAPCPLPAFRTDSDLKTWKTPEIAVLLKMGLCLKRKKRCDRLSSFFLYNFRSNIFRLQIFFAVSLADLAKKDKPDSFLLCASSLIIFCSITWLSMELMQAHGFTGAINFQIWLFSGNLNWYISKKWACLTLIKVFFPHW